MLTPAERKALKAKAHKLDPVVHIGAKGLTDEVIAEIDRALHAHELIKVRAASLDRDAREEAFGRIARKNRRRGGAAHRQGVRALQEEER